MQILLDLEPKSKVQPPVFVKTISKIYSRLLRTETFFTPCGDPCPRPPPDQLTLGHGDKWRGGARGIAVGGHHAASISTINSTSIMQML